MGKRLLGVIRLSRETEESTSPQRQRQIIQNWADARGDEIIDWAEDLGVSASIDPMDRPEFGAWLRGEKGPFDGLVAWRVDRLARRVLHFARLLEWARIEGKDIASATEGFDLSTPLGRMFAQMIAMLAEGELEAIKERTKGSYDHLVSVGRHRGGFMPYGYRSVLNPNGRGFVLEVDADSARQLRDMVRRVVDGESISSIVTDLNGRKVPTPLAIQRMRVGRAPEDPKTGRLPVWRVGAMAKLMRSQTLLGYLSPDSRSPNGPPVDDSGKRVRRADPILSRSEWDELQAVLDARGGVKGPRPGERWGASMLLRVAHCGHDVGDGQVCGTRLYQVQGRSAKYYRCGSKAIGGTACGGRAIMVAKLESAVQDSFLDKFGDIAVCRRTFAPGEDHTGEIREVEDALARLTRRLEKVPDGPAADAVVARMAEHTQHLAHLRTLPNRPAGWVLETTGETYEQLWARLDEKGRGKLLRDCRVRVVLTSARPLVLDLDWGDLTQAQDLALRAAAILAGD